MERVTLKELQSTDMSKICVLDIRKREDFERGGLYRAENTVNIPYAEFKTGKGLLPEGLKICVLCYTGDKSEEITERLEYEGFDAANIEGGYREYLRKWLTEADGEEAAAERTKNIERSIIKKFRKPIWRKFTKAVNEYELIDDGDRIAVCISGGKDSMLMAKLFQELYRHGRKNFEPVFLVMNPGYNEENWRVIQDNMKALGIPAQSFETEIYDIVAGVEQSPCYLCARMRRGHLYSKARELGCNKIALGHHFDDVIETTLMSMLYSGKIETMLPKLKSKNFDGMELIRPMYMIREADIKAWRDYNNLYFIQCACRFTEHCASCGGGRDSKREEMKELIEHFRNISSVIDINIFNSVSNVNMDMITGWKKNGEKHSYLEEY